MAIVVELGHMVVHGATTTTTTTMFPVFPHKDGPPIQGGVMHPLHRTTGLGRGSILHNPTPFRTPTWLRQYLCEYHLPCLTHVLAQLLFIHIP